MSCQAIRGYSWPCNSLSDESPIFQRNHPFVAKNHEEKSTNKGDWIQKLRASSYAQNRTEGRSAKVESSCRKKRFTYKLSMRQAGPKQISVNLVKWKSKSGGAKKWSISKTWARVSLTHHISLFSCRLCNSSSQQQQHPAKPGFNHDMKRETCGSYRTTRTYAGEGTTSSVACSCELGGSCCAAGSGVP